MRLQTVSCSAVSVKVLKTDPHKITAELLPVMYGSNSTSGITSQVDGTISDTDANIPVTISRTTTTATVTFPANQPHRLGGTSDYVTITGTGNANFDGTYPVASVTSDTVLTYTVANSGATAGAGFASPLRTIANVIASASASATVPALPAVTTTSVYLDEIPFSALILKCTAWTAGTVYLDVREQGL